MSFHPTYQLNESCVDIKNNVKKIDCHEKMPTIY